MALPNLKDICNGHAMHTHFRHAPSKEVLLFLDDSADCFGDDVVYWCLPDVKKKTTDKIAVKDIEACLPAKYTAVFETPECKDLPDNCCFSLVSSQGIVGFTAKTPAVAQLWIAQIGWLIEHKTLSKSEQLRALTQELAKIQTSRDTTLAEHERKLEEIRKQLDKISSGVKLAPEEKTESKGEEQMLQRGRAVRLSLTEIPKAWLGSQAAQQRPLTSKLLTVERTGVEKPHRDVQQLVFGQDFTDHMLEADWDLSTGWSPPRIVPFHELLMSPACSAIHYGLEIFEGMKAYLDDKGHIRLFRPMKNLERMLASAKRMSLPLFDTNELLSLIKSLLIVDKSWIPEKKGYSLYIRPSLYSTHPSLGVSFPQKCKLAVICSPVGPYFKAGFTAVKLLCDPTYIRAWPKGTGNIKCGGNYAPCIMPMAAAKARGFAEVMWTEPALGHVKQGEKRQNYLTEVGAMNLFFIWKNLDGKVELITATLDMGTVLPGVTRDSILGLARSWNEFVVSERRYTIDEVIRAIDEGRMLESFGTGTAAVVTPICGFEYLGKFYDIPVDPALKAGKISKRLFDSLLDIQQGRVAHEWSTVVEEPAAPAKNQKEQ